MKTFSRVPKDIEGPRHCTPMDKLILTEGTGCTKVLSPSSWLFESPEISVFCYNLIKTHSITCLYSP